MSPCQEYAEDIEQWFYSPRYFFFEQLPLILSKAKVVVSVVSGDAAFCDPLQLLMFRSCMNDKRGIELFEHISVGLQKQTEEFLNIVSHQIQFKFIMLRQFHGVALSKKTKYLFRREDMCSPEVVIRIWR